MVTNIGLDTAENKPSKAFVVDLVGLSQDGGNAANSFAKDPADSFPNAAPARDLRQANLKRSLSVHGAEIDA